MRILATLIIFLASAANPLVAKPKRALTCKIDGFRPGEKVTASRFPVKVFRCTVGPENLVSFENRKTSILVGGREIIVVSGETLRFSDGSFCSIGQSMDVAKSLLKRSGFRMDLMLDDIVRCREVFSMSEQSVLRIQGKGGKITKITGTL